MSRHRALRALFACLFLPVLAAAADKVVGGPMVVNAGTRNATVVWIVESSQASLGLAPGELEKAAPALRAEKVGFSGLKAGTEYHYDTPAGKGSFRTPRPADGQPFEFVVFGDTRTRHDVHRRIMTSMLNNSAPEFVLHSGDLVQDGYDSAQWPVFFDIERELLRKVAYYPALGNHERNCRQFYEFFQVGEPFYSFTWGKAHFIVINSDLGNIASTPSLKESFWTRQRNWLEDELIRSQSADYRFVLAHHPPVTAVSSRQAGNPEMAALVPMFEKYRVTAGFFGHDHNYQHFLQKGVRYLISGGGGAPLYDVAAPPAGITQKVSSVEHFVRIRVNGATATVAAIDIDGKVIDEFTLAAAPAPAPVRAKKN